MSRPFRTITVRALIELLEDEDPDALVAFSSDYGDYTHTEQVHPISGELETVTLEESAYSDSGWAVLEEEEEEELEDGEEPEAKADPVITVLRIK